MPKFDFSLCSDEGVKIILCYAIEANLPPELTREQALYWIKHPKYLQAALGDLAKVSVPKQ